MQKPNKTNYHTKDDGYKLAELDMVIVLNGKRTANKPLRTIFYLKDIEIVRRTFETLYGNKINLIYHEVEK